jgi:hypothetical protein
MEPTGLCNTKDNDFTDSETFIRNSQEEKLQTSQEKNNKQEAVLKWRFTWYNEIRK